MNLLPQSSGLRPRLACEIATGGVVAARSAEPGAPLAAIARVELAEGAVSPNLKPGNVPDRIATIAALRRALEAVGAKSNARNADLTLVIPDGAVRVLLLDFDSLPGKLSEALPIVRFRLKKLLPFDADDAMISFQIMSTSRTVVRVLAVAVPRDVLSEYESIAREAGFEPGAVLPSTLAALAGLDEGEGASLLVNTQRNGVTTAIVRAGILQLHRTVDLVEQALGTPANLPAALFERSPNPSVAEMLPLVDREETAGEWAAQEPAREFPTEFGHNPYADRAAAEMAVENEDGLTNLPEPYSFNGTGNAAGQESHASVAPSSPTRFPYAAPGLMSDFAADSHLALLTVRPDPNGLAEPAATDGRALFSVPPAAADFAEPEPSVHSLAPDVRAEEIARAVSVAMAYFEDSLGTAPTMLLSAGPLGAEELSRTLREQGVVQTESSRVRELVQPASITSDALSATVPRGWLAGVVGALKS